MGKTVTITAFDISVTPSNPLWEGFMRFNPVCSCGSRWAQRFDGKPWRCKRGHFVTKKSPDA